VNLEVNQPMLALILAVSEGGGEGFDPVNPAAGGNFFWTLLIFFGALPFIWSQVMGKVTNALEERDAHAARAIAAAEKASSEAEKARADVEVALGEAQAQAAQLLSEARERAEAREHEIVSAAKTEAAAMVEAARKAIRAEQDKAISTIRGEVVELTMSAASRVIGRNVGGEDDRRIVSDLISTREAASN